MGRWLGRGLANLAAVIDPAVFVIGGGVSAAGELLLGPAREEFAHALTGRGFRPAAQVDTAALGPDAGLVGAADLARTARRVPLTDFFPGNRRCWSCTSDALRGNVVDVFLGDPSVAAS